MIFKQILILLMLVLVFGTISNFVSPNKIPFIGQYRELSSGDGPIVPPSASEGDPPFISVDVAELEYSLNNAVFVDARDHSEFVCGTIPGAINIPFDFLPEENIEHYIDSALNYIPKDKHIIVFCSGEECDLSLHMARNLQDLDYTSLSIFFGGAREWEKFGLEMERREKCGE